MNEKRPPLTNLLLRSVTCGLVFVLVVSLSYAPISPITKRADALVAVVEPSQMSAIIKFLGAITQSTAISAGVDKTLVEKEFHLDNLVFMAINVVLQIMSRDIISWINSGFKGSPAFVSNLDQFLIGIADKVAGEFIWGSDLAFLCSPFKLDIRLALDMQYGQTKQRKFNCSLSGVVKNIDNFLDGDFLAGGWDGWFSMTSQPVNNPYGALLEAQTTLALTVSNAQGQQVKILDFGKGFLSKQKCESVDDESGGHQECKTVTPGSAIEEQLNAQLDSGRQRIQVADEFNEIVGALLTQLVSKAFTGVSGLLGSSGHEPDDQGNTYNFWQDTQDDPEVTEVTTISPVINAIQDEMEYLTLEGQMLAMLQDAQNYKEDRYPGDACHSGDLPDNLQNQLNTISGNITMANRITLILQEIDAEYQATTSPNGKLNILEGYISLKENGALHGASVISQVTFIEIPQLEEAITAFKQEVDAACIPPGSGAAG